jgi:hypothetical protein
VRVVKLDDQGVLDGEVAVAVYLQDGHEVWLVNPRCTVEEIVDGCNKAIRSSHELSRVSLRRRLEVWGRRRKRSSALLATPLLLLLKHLPVQGTGAPHDLL